MLDVAGEPQVIFEGFGEGAELLGATQVNFIAPGIEREFAMTINDPALDRAVQESGLEASPEIRLTVARELARLLLLRKLASRHMEPLNFYGLRLFDENPGIAEELRAVLAKA